MSISLIRQKRTADGLIRMASEKSDLGSVTFHSHDWTDQTTWCETATRHVDEVASVDVPYTVYSVANAPMVDAYHGKITQEDFKVDSGGNSFRVEVKVNDVVKTEQDPDEGMGGDFVVDYEAGKITFLSPLIISDTVKVTYHGAGSSLLTIAPEPGKVLRVEVVEVQFSADVVLNDSAVFQPVGYVDVFAPHLTPVPFPSLTKIPLGDPFIYKSMRDYMNDAFRSYPSYPAMGGVGYRGINQPVLVMDWDYTRAKPLYSSYGQEIHVSLKNDTPFGGTYATATFYCSTEDE